MSSGTRVRAQRPRSAVVAVDDEALASAIVEVLGGLGWETYEVESFRDARRAIEQFRPGVLIIDPGLHVDLLEKFFAQLATDDAHPGVVLLSDLTTAASLADEHNVIFVREPFDLDDLTAAVEAARHGEAPDLQRIAKQRA